MSSRYGIINSKINNLSSGASNDVNLEDTQTLTNKTLDLDVNTITRGGVVIVDVSTE